MHVSVSNRQNIIDKIIGGVYKRNKESSSWYMSSILVVGDLFQNFQFMSGNRCQRWMCSRGRDIISFQCAIPRPRANIKDPNTNRPRMRSIPNTLHLVLSSIYTIQYVKIYSTINDVLDTCNIYWLIDLCSPTYFIRRIRTYRRNLTT